MSLQYLTLQLDGITAGDYLTWVRDPEPSALGASLDSITVQADPLGETIEAVLSWNRAPPAARTAALTAGFPLTPEVSAVESRTLAAAA
jgi:hypothetical protein